MRPTSKLFRRLLLFNTVLLLFELAHSTCTLSPRSGNPHAPILVTLNNGKASRSLPMRLCTSDPSSVDVSNTTITSSVLSLRPQLSVSKASISASRCIDFDAYLAFRAGLSRAQLTLTVPNACSHSFPVIASGVTAFSLPHLVRVTAPSATAVMLPAPRNTSSKLLLAVNVVLPNGDATTGLPAARLVTATTSSDLPNVSVRLAQQDRPMAAGNLVVEAKADESDTPRAALQFQVMLRVPSTKAVASFHVNVEALHTIVEEIRVPSPTMANAGGAEVKLVVSRAGGDQRRLVLLLPLSNDSYQRIIAREVGYGKEGDDYVSTIKLPALEPSVIGKLEWVYEVIDDGRVTTAADETGEFLLKFGWKPVLYTISPQRVTPGNGGFMTLVGEFSDSAKSVFFNGKRLGDRDVLSISKSEIALRVPQSYTRRNGTTVSVVVRDESGLASEPVSFSVSSSALNVKAIVLQSSFEKRTGRSLVPFFCDQRNAPTVFVSVDSIGTGTGDELPKYSFSMRTSSMLPGESRILSSGSNNIVTLSDRNLFQDSETVQDEMVTVFVHVAFGDHRGEAVLFISRRLRKDKVGMTVLSLADGSSKPNSDLILESTLSPVIHCPSLGDLTVETQWTINRKRVRPRTSDSDPTTTANGPVLLGFGNRLLLPRTKKMRYELSVRLTDRSNTLIADGYWMGQAQRQSGQNPLHVLLNGGMKLMSIPTDEEFSIEGMTLDGPVVPSDEKPVKYSWTCSESMSKHLSCPDSLFPSALRSEKTKVASFTGSAPRDWEGRTLEYSLQVSDDHRESEVAVLLVSFVHSRIKPFPPAMLRTATGVPSSGTSRHGLTFQAHDDVILWIAGPVPDSELDFALFHDEKHDDLLRSNDDIKLISHNGYWTPERRKSKFLGISAHSLWPGNYRLQGSCDGINVNSSTGVSSWMFAVAPSPRLILSEPPITDGFVDQTLFHAAAMSVPSSMNQFFFRLKSVDDDDGMRSFASMSLMPTAAENCLGACNGLPSETFAVGTPGRYVLSVDMYDPDGSRLIASREGIVVIRVHGAPSSPAPAAQDHDGVISKIQSSLQHMDEVTFLNAVMELSTLPSVPSKVFSDAVGGLARISATKIGNPLQVVRVIEACTSIVKHEDFQDVTLLSSLRGVVQNCVRQTQQTGSSGTRVREALGRFYGAAADKLAEVVNADTDESRRSEEVSRAVSELRTAAAQDLILVLSTGTECGAVERVLVPRTSVSSHAFSGTDGETTFFDDYRVGVSCFNGQITSLSPEPVLSEVCERAKEDSVVEDPHVNIFAAIERHEASEHLSSDDILSGPTVYVETLRWQTAGEKQTSLEDADSWNDCFRSRVSVFAYDRVENDTRFTKEDKIQCRGAGKAFASKAVSGSDFEYADAESSDINDFQLHRDGRISSIVEHNAPGAVRMEVNDTLLRVCFQTSVVEGRNRANFAASLASILGAVFAFVAVLCLVVLYSTSCFDRFESFSVPSSAAPVNSFATSRALTHSTRDGASTLNSDEETHVPNGWEAEYGSLSVIADREIDSDSTVGNSRDVRNRRTTEIDDFTSRGTMQGFRRVSLTDVPAVIPWMANSTSTFSDRNRQIDFLGSSSSSLDYFVPDTYGRSDRMFR